jgi:hypothetical protein
MQKYQLTHENLSGLHYVLETNGAEIDEDDEIEFVCSSGQTLMFLMENEHWTSPRK